MSNIVSLEDCKRISAWKDARIAISEDRAEKVRSTFESLKIKKDLPSFLGEGFFLINYIELVRKKNIKVLIDYDGSVASHFGIKRMNSSVLNRENNTIYLSDYRTSGRFSNNDMYMERQICRALYYHICEISPLDCICVCNLSNSETDEMFNSFYTKKNVR